jgi:hypothetical protein
VHLVENRRLIGLRLGRHKTFPGPPNHPDFPATRLKASRVRSHSFTLFSFAARLDYHGGIIEFVMRIWVRNRHSREIRILVLLAGAIALFKPPISKSQQTPDQVSIRVHFNQSEGPLSPIWNYFGYDEPNYTYAPNGKKLLGELAALNAAPVYVRMHNLLTSGDGSASLKWGSTNVYTEDAFGYPIYSWEILDRIFDTFHSTGVKPLVEIGFMPEALSRC